MVVACIKQSFLLKNKHRQYILIIFLHMNFFKILLFLNFKLFFKLLQQINKYIIHIYSFLFNTFINLYFRCRSKVTSETWIPNITSVLQHHDEGYACKQLQVQTSPRSTHKPSGISQFWNFLSVFCIGSMVVLANSKIRGRASKSEGGPNYNWIPCCFGGKQDQMWNYTYKSWYFDWERPHALNQG